MFLSRDPRIHSSSGSGPLEGIAGEYHGPIGRDCVGILQESRLNWRRREQNDVARTSILVHFEGTLLNDWN
jgi:hypothetical protein